MRAHGATQPLLRAWFYAQPQPKRSKLYPVRTRPSKLNLTPQLGNTRSQHEAGDRFSRFVVKCRADVAVHAQGDRDS